MGYKNIAQYSNSTRTSTFKIRGTFCTLRLFLKGRHSIIKSENTVYARIYYEAVLRAALINFVWGTIVIYCLVGAGEFHKSRIGRLVAVAIEISKPSSVFLYFEPFLKNFKC